MSDFQFTAAQTGPSVVGEGVVRTLRGTRAGQLFTADWKTELILAGLGFNVTVGGITAGAAEALITGGGNGTTIDTDQPEMAIGTPAGYYHVPLSFRFGGRADFDADAETAECILFADQTQRIPAPVIASSTLETPQNLLDGGPASVSYAQSAVTADITDPVLSQYLAFTFWRASEITAAGAHDTAVAVDYDPSFPTLLKGPCSVVAAWGGSAAVPGACTYCWAEVPLSRFE